MRARAAAAAVARVMARLIGRRRGLPRHLVATERRRLALLLLTATVVRLALLGTPGYDVRDYKVWARVVDAAGIGGAYTATYPPPVPWFNYPPFYLYVLRATGAVYAALEPGGDWGGQILAALLKVSPIAAEIVLGLLLYRFLRRRRGERPALLGAAAYLLNPAIIWNTAYWGGIDAFHALFLTAALLAASAGHPARAWPLATLAVGAKLLALPGALATVPPALRQAVDRMRAGASLRGEVGRLALAALGAFAAGLALAAPVLFAGQFGAMVGAMVRNLGNTPVASANAHNLWWLLTGGDGWRPDTTALAFGLDFRRAGLLLFGLATLPALAWLWGRADPGAPASDAAPCEAGAFLVFAFFILTTEVHENWSFALFAPLLVAAVLRRPGAGPRAGTAPTRLHWLYAALSQSCLLNLALHDPPLRHFVGTGFDGTAATLGLLNAAAQCGLFGWWAWAIGREVWTTLAARRPGRVWPHLRSLVPRFLPRRMARGLGRGDER